MARGKTLENLVQQLRSECRNSSAVNVGVDFNDIYKQTIRRVYEFLYDDYDWPHLLIKPTKNLADGQYLYDLPTDLDLERIEEVYVWYSGYPHPLERGINIVDYNEYNSSAGEKVDPVRKWDLFWTGTATQVEVWPMPASNVQYLQFVGRKKYVELVEDSDVALLDDRLIVLSAAAEILADQKNPSANQKLSLARERYSRLKGRVTGGSRMITLGGTSGDEDRPRGTIIRVS